MNNIELSSNRKINIPQTYIFSKRQLNQLLGGVSKGRTIQNKRVLLPLALLFIINPR